MNAPFALVNSSVTQQAVRFTMCSGKGAGTCAWSQCRPSALPAIRTVASTELRVQPRPQMYSASAKTAGCTHASSNTGSSPSGVAQARSKLAFGPGASSTARRIAGSDPVGQLTINGDDRVAVLAELVQVLLEPELLRSSE